MAQDTVSCSSSYTCTCKSAASHGTVSSLTQSGSPALSALKTLFSYQMSGCWGIVPSLSSHHTGGKKNELNIYWFTGTIDFTFSKSSHYCAHNTSICDSKPSLSLPSDTKSSCQNSDFSMTLPQNRPKMRWHAKLLTTVNCFMNTKARVNAAAAGPFRYVELDQVAGRQVQTAQLTQELQNAT